MSIGSIQKDIERIKELLEHPRVVRFPCRTFLLDTSSVLSNHVSTLSDSDQYPALQDVSIVLAELLRVLNIVTTITFFRKSRYSSTLSNICSRLLSSTTSLISQLSSKSLDVHSSSLSSINDTLQRIGCVLGFEDCLYPTPNDRVSALFLAHKYFNGHGISRDIGRALNLYLSLARTGCDESMISAGLILIEGEDVKKDPVQAIKLIEEAASLDNKSALAVLGDYYSTGLSLCSSNFSNTQLEELSDHVSGDQVSLIEKNINTAREMYERAIFKANAGQNQPLKSILIDDCDYSVVTQLSELIYAHFPNDLALAFDLISIAAQQDHPIALNNLGMLHFNGFTSDEWSITRNIPLGVRLFKQSADLCCAYAYFNLGIIYENGLNGLIDLELALDYYSRSTSRLPASSNLSKGRIFVRQKRYSNARHSLRIAHDHGSIEAMYYLGELARRGLGSPTDTLTAYEYFCQGSKHGCCYSIVGKGDLLYIGVGDYPRSVVGAALSYGEAAVMGNAEGCYKLAVLIDEGELGRDEIKSINKKLALFKDDNSASAEYWFIQAALRSHGQAMLCLARHWLDKGSVFISSESNEELYDLLKKTRVLLLGAMSLEVFEAEEWLRKVEIDLKQAFNDELDYTTAVRAKEIVYDDMVMSVLPDVGCLRQAEKKPLSWLLGEDLEQKFNLFQNLEAQSPVANV
ncbi:hypothetical protein GEMRC1_005608 [Eukaryota sp. GEM-RC1]